MARRKRGSSMGWDRFQEDVTELGTQLRKIVRDTELRASTSKAAQSFGAALAQTVRELANGLGAAARRRR